MITAAAAAAAAEELCRVDCVIAQVIIFADSVCPSSVALADPGFRKAWIRGTEGQSPSAVQG